MRQIRFRGFHPCDGEEEILLSDGSLVRGRWVFGDLLHNNTDCCIVEQFQMIPVRAFRGGEFTQDYVANIKGEKVIPETVEQATTREKLPARETPTREEATHP